MSEWNCEPMGSICPSSPIVLDTADQGFHLTSRSNGVQFRALPGGPLQQMSWTDANWRNGWLALDRNGNGTIDDFTELFGDLTPSLRAARLTVSWRWRFSTAHPTVATVMATSIRAMQCTRV